MRANHIEKEKQKMSNLYDVPVWCRLRPVATDNDDENDDEDIDDDEHICEQMIVHASTAQKHQIRQNFPKYRIFLYWIEHALKRFHIRQVSGSACLMTSSICQKGIQLLLNRLLYFP